MSHESFFDDLESPDVSITSQRRMVSIVLANHYVGSPIFRARSDNLQDGTLIFSIKTVQEDGTRHPYFEEHRAGDIAARAIKYFEQFEPVNAIDMRWDAPQPGNPRSDNYTTYREARERFGQQMPYEQAKVRAAMATWTFQRIALPNGFTKIGKVNELAGTDNPISVWTIASRPSS